MVTATKDQRDILMSIRPIYSDLIFGGQKKAELRRRTPHASAGTRVWVYSTAPEKAIVGSFTIADIVKAHLPELWKMVGHASAVERIDFDNYFRGKNCGCAIMLEEPQRLKSPISLNHLREIVPGFHPPQAYRFLPGVMATLLV